MHNISVLGLFTVSFIDPDGFRYIDVYVEDDIDTLFELSEIDIFH